jgi:hypothetical protein
MTAGRRESNDERTNGRNEPSLDSGRRQLGTTATDVSSSDITFDF